MKRTLIKLVYAFILGLITVFITDHYNLQFSSIVVGMIIMGLFDIGDNVIDNTTITIKK